MGFLFSAVHAARFLFIFSPPVPPSLPYTFEVYLSIFFYFKLSGFDVTGFNVTSPHVFRCSLICPLSLSPLFFSTRYIDYIGP